MNPFVPYHDVHELKRRLFETLDRDRWADAQKGLGRFTGARLTREEIDGRGGRRHGGGPPLPR